LCRQSSNDLNFLFTTPVDLAELKTIAEPCASELIIKGDLYKQLKQMCRNQAITLNVAVQFAWHKLLHIYSGDEQTIVGTTVAGRDLPVDGIESSVGLYINTLPLTVDWDNSISVSAILNKIYNPTLLSMPSTGRSRPAKVVPTIVCSSPL
jgi:hypothetical protein